MTRRAGLFRLPVLAQDVLLALFVVLAQGMGTVRASENSDIVARSLDDFGHLGYLLLVLSGLALVVRRRWPVPVFIFSAVSSLVYYAADYPDGTAWVGLFVALYTLTAYGDGRRSIRIAAWGVAALAVGWLITGVDVEPEAARGWVFFRIGASVMAAALGESVRSRRVIAIEAHERAERAERTREEEARSRVNAERLRIAREVHDTVAHAIAIINVQAGVTAHVLDKRPERARETLVTIEQTSAQALHEMRAILGVLRDSDNGRIPSPGLAQIDELTAMARDAGLDVKLETSSTAVQVPSAVDSAAYRILQESITNVIRHAGQGRVTVSLDYGRDMLEIRVIDDGPGSAGVGTVASSAAVSVPASALAAGAATGVGTGAATGSGTGAATGAGTSPDTGVGIGTGVGTSTNAGAAAVVNESGDAPAPGTGVPGRGIVGMRERCALLGGDLTAGPRPEGGFEVRAQLPLSPAGTVNS